MVQIRVRRFALWACAAAVLAACGGGDGSTAPVAVANISVSLAQSSVVVGSGTTASAVLRDGAGATLSGRTVVWSSSSPSVAVVSADGVVTALAGGTTSISATSEGRSGAAPLTVFLPPVTSVTLTGPSRVKVGDTYSYSATLRLADGNVVSRPMAWSITDPARATITSTGVLTALQPGAFTIQLVVDGEAWTSQHSAYDWEVLNGSTAQFVFIKADNTITNRFGTADYAELIFSCGTSGYFFVWVSTPHVITASGLVAFSFDGGTPISQTWDELSPSYRTLWKPGSNGVIKSFALDIQTARQFGFAFGEFQGSAKAMTFRVGGLGTHLPPLLAACPANAMTTSADVIEGDLAEQRTILDQRSERSATSPLVVNASQQRGLFGPMAIPGAGLAALLESMVPLPAVHSQSAQRR